MLLPQNLDLLYPVYEFDPDFVYHDAPWIVEGLWKKGRIAGVFGMMKAGKSRLTCWIMTAALIGQSEVVGRKIETDIGTTLYLAGEEPVSVVFARCRRYAYLMAGKDGVNILKGRLKVIEASGMHLEQQHYRDWLYQGIIKKHKVETLLIDPYRRVQMADENSSTQLSGLHGELRMWANKGNLTSVFEHHTGHKDPLELDKLITDDMGTWARGSSDIPAIIDTGMYVDRVTQSTTYTGRGTDVRVLRGGRMPDTLPFHVVDLGADPPKSSNPEHDLGFETSHALATLSG